MSTLKLNNVTTLTESSGAITLANSALGTPTSVNLTNATFPSGHIIKSDILYIDQDASSAVATDQGSYQDTGLGATITTVKASSASRLVFNMFIGMSHVGTGYVGQSTMTLRASSSSTTYSTLDDIVGTATLYRNYVAGGLHKPRYYELHYKAGTDAIPSNLTSYTAGQTLYCRWFFLISASTNSWIHANSHVVWTYQEIAL